VEEEDSGGGDYDTVLKAHARSGGGDYGAVLKARVHPRFDSPLLAMLPSRLVIHLVLDYWGFAG
jgi:hypothetical protein